MGDKKIVIDGFQASVIRSVLRDRIDSASESADAYRQTQPGISYSLDIHVAELKELLKVFEEAKK